MNPLITSVALIALGLIGLYLRIDYSGWVLAVGLLTFWVNA